MPSSSLTCLPATRRTINVAKRRGDISTNTPVCNPKRNCGTRYLTTCALQVPRDVTAAQACPRDLVTLLHVYKLWRRHRCKSERSILPMGYHAATTAAKQRVLESQCSAHDPGLLSYPILKSFGGSGITSPWWMIYPTPGFLILMLWLSVSFERHGILH